MSFGGALGRIWLALEHMWGFDDVLVINGTFFTLVDKTTD